jgi:hypothetical protein
VRSDFNFLNAPFALFFVVVVPPFVSSIQTNFYGRRILPRPPLLLPTTPPCRPKPTSNTDAPPHAFHEGPPLAWNSIRESVRATPDYICAYGGSAGKRVPARGRGGLCAPAVCEGREERRTTGW